MFDFDTSPSRSGGDSLKWNKYAQTHPDAIGAWVADTDFRAAPAILDALRKRIDGPALGYCDEPAELIDVVIKRLAQLYGWQVDPSWLVSLPGIVPGLFGAVRATGKPGDAVITQTPNYPRFYSAADFSARRLQFLHSRIVDGRWQIDADQLETLAAQGASTLLLCNPHNPLGTVLSPDELDAIARVCLEYNIVVCSDEVHAELVLDPEVSHTPIATLSDAMANQTITLIGPGKAFNLAGVLGYGLAIIPNPDLREAFKQQVYGISGHISGLAQLATLAAYRDGDDWLAAQINYLRGNRDRLESAIAELDGISMTHVEATFLAWLNVSALELDDPHRFFLSHGVAMSDGKEMGAPGYLRLNFGCSRATLDTLLERIERATAAV